MTRLMLAALLATVAVAPLAAQTNAMTEAYAQERRGDYRAAADAYFAILRQQPENLSALLGLERVLTPLHRESELALPAETLIARTPDNVAAYSVAMRGWAAANRPDSVAAVAQRWAHVEPGSETPYREWGNTLLGQRDGNGARKAYLTGREQLRDSTALAGELALLSAAQNEWGSAAREWGLALERYPGYRLSARNALLRAPAAEHEPVSRQLSRGSPAARRLGAELDVQWGKPAEAYTILVANLPASPNARIDALRQFLDAARSVDGPEAALVRGQAFEQVAMLATGTAAARARLDAARAYADGGDAVSARRMLAALAADGATPADMASSATSTLVTVLLREGNVAEAEGQLAELRGTLGSEGAGQLTLQVAEGWIRQGNLDRAEAVLSSDSAVDVVALRGLILLYRGDLAGAATALREAGPFAGSREEATTRTAVLALIQPMQSDMLPALGAALLTLARGDSTAAAAALVTVADGLPTAGGGSELRLLAGRIEGALGHDAAAEALLRTASDSTAPATAPAAELALARLLLTLGRRPEAMAQLEHLILTYPGSAAVPQARRLLDAVRGGIPES